MIDFGLRRATNVHWQALDVEQVRARPSMKGQKPAVLWFTGLSGSGKSTIANLVERTLFARGPPHLSARRRQCPPRAQPRSRLHRCRPRGKHPPRRRSGEAVRRCGPDRAGVVHLAVPLGAAHGARAGGRGRVHRGLRRYADRGLHGSAIPRASTRRRRAGEIKNFTGIDSPYEAPEAAELTLKTVGTDAETLATQTVEFLRSRGLIP